MEAWTREQVGREVVRWAARAFISGIIVGSINGAVAVSCGAGLLP